MSTYSLTLRQPLGRKLTISELDNNFLYLQELALSATGGSASIGSEFEQTNTTSGFKLVNKSEVSVLLGTISLAGSYFTNSTSSWFNGIVDATQLGGGLQTGMSYIDTSSNLFQVSINDVNSALDAINTNSSYGTQLILATAGTTWRYVDVNSDAQNIVIISDIGIRNYVATQSSISFGSITDPFNSPITQDFVTIDGVGNFESFNPNSGFSIGNVSDNTDFIGGLTTSYAGVWDNGSPFQGIGLISLPDFGFTYSSMFVNYVGEDAQQIRVIPGFGIQIISDMGGTESHIYVNEFKIELAYEGQNTRIVLDSSGLRLNTTQELYMNGLTAWSGTYSTADGRVATVTKGIITNVS
jgi:hypothetical protein